MVDSGMKSHDRCEATPGVHAPGTGRKVNGVHNSRRSSWGGVPLLSTSTQTCHSVLRQYPLAAAIVELLANPTEMAAMGQRGIRWAQKFDWPASVQTAESVFREFGLLG